MSSFHDFLRARLDTGGFSTEDTLASLLPLIREVLETHAAGMVAPLEGLDDLHVEGVRLWFEEARRQPLRQQTAAVRRVEAANSSAVEVLLEARRTTEVDHGQQSMVDLAIGRRDQPVTRPVYLPGYVSWEHELGHHDPLTDVFSLGMILASLACGLDFSDERDLAAFVEARRNLFDLAPNLHPVLARAITRMTELDRHRRAQDLRALRNTLENYRDQEVDFEFDLARIRGFQQQDLRSKQAVVLTKLRERLFELSKRNRLLHFRATMQSVNLTHASVPLSFDIKNVRPDQILVWNRDAQDALVSGKPFSLNKYLNFAEAIYLPPVLDRLIAEARRDEAEYGFAQLRLTACFLNWANLKEQPVERYCSPLVLLPVKLTRKKGIRDTYWLQALSTNAEINPVIRHQFKQLYGIDLPESIDLTTNDLDQLFDYMQKRIESSDVAVTLSKIDRPRIALIHDKARRKLDQYRRRARLAGRGIRNFLNLDYSYDPANYHPLGITLFSAKVRPPETHLRAILEEKPRPRTFMTAEPDPPAAEKERSFFSLQEGGEDNPYSWTFDLCSVTLSNFKYRKMSLVRDYEALLLEEPKNAAFEATFSLAPRPTEQQTTQVPPLTDRYDVVPCDPTQALAIQEAQEQSSYIIQGPPGTGKSQTITNLIADYAARGKRVLFVCEKRAAIDVVYARLRQCGLADLCCLIHDSQTDKREFVMNLKQTYEGSLADQATRPGNERERILNQLSQELVPLKRFSDAMCDARPDAAVPLRQLLDRCIALGPPPSDMTPLQREQLPSYADWVAHREAIQRFEARLSELQPSRVAAHHPLRFLTPQLANEQYPLETVTESLHAADLALSELTSTLHHCDLPPELWHDLDHVEQLVRYAQFARPIAGLGHFGLLDAESGDAGRLRQHLRKIRRGEAALAEAQEATRAWRQKLSEREVGIALDQSRAFDRKMLSWLSPAWWRLRAALRRAYDFRSHVVQPSWTRVLEELQAEYACAAKLAALKQSLLDEFRIGGEADDFLQSLSLWDSASDDFSDAVRRAHRHLLRSGRGDRTVDDLAQLRPQLDILRSKLDSLTELDEAIELNQLGFELSELRRSLDQLPDWLHCLSEIAPLPRQLSRVLRRMPYTPAQLEAAIADNQLQQIYREDRLLQQFDGKTRSRQAARLETLYKNWLAVNSGEIRRRVQQRFRQNVHTCGLPAAQLTPEQKEFKKTYNRGRRELEHEFGKSMRYKSIRDLVSGESGEVVKDLKPVWLMSPLSVSDTLPLDTRHFDVVIFDEASQITLEEAVPALFRAGQSIVVGDEMQLPPTDFFAAKRSDDEDELLVDEGGELVEYDMASNSFLNHAARNLPSTMLGWHYRSRSESLISFSNWTFYGGRLLTVPEEQLPRPERAPLIAQRPDDAAAFAAELLARPISFHFMQHGIYDQRRNRSEADYIAQLVRALLTENSPRTIGIVAFSEAQQQEIEGALQRLAQSDKLFRTRLDAELEREEDGQFVGLLVKNLENIQGDERDVIILSVCYGHDERGRMRMNFGPINKSGGEKRLNVAFSRARHHMALVSSIRYGDITNDYNDGANCLKQYLRYAEASSKGDRNTAMRVLHGMGHWQDQLATEPLDVDPLVEQLAERLESHGYLTDRRIGQSNFRCDLAVRRPGDDQYRLGILLDNHVYYEQTDLLERDVLRPKLLRDFGWKILCLLAKDWHDDPEGTFSRILRLLEDQPLPDEPSGGEVERSEEAVERSNVASSMSAGHDHAPALEDSSGGEDDDADAPPPAGAVMQPAADHPAADVPAAAGLTSPLPQPDGAPRYFECTSGTSHKFWEITLAGAQHSVRFGRIGTAGQTRTKSFADAAAAQRDYERLVQEKRTKGYREK